MESFSASATLSAAANGLNAGGVAVMLCAWAILALATGDGAFRAHVAARLLQWEQARARRRLAERGLSSSRRGCASAGVAR